MIDFLILLCLGLFFVIVIFLALMPIMLRNLESSKYMVDIQNANFNHKVKMLDQEENTMSALSVVYGRENV